jgi:hypothetical protein
VHNTEVAHASSPPAGLDRIDRMAVVVEDIGRSVQWYQNHLKCTVLWPDATWTYLLFANCGLGLVTPHHNPAHFAVLSPMSPDITRFGTLQTHGDGTRFAYINDGSGNVTEMLERLSR